MTWNKSIAAAAYLLGALPHAFRLHEVVELVASSSLFLAAHNYFVGPSGEVYGEYDVFNAFGDLDNFDHIEDSKWSSPGESFIQTSLARVNTAVTRFQVVFAALFYRLY